MRVVQRAQSNFRVFLPVFTTYFIDSFGLAVVYPILTSLLLLPEFGLVTEATSSLTRTLLLGLLIASFPMAQFFGAPLFGSASDRIGRRKIFLMTISGGIVGYFLTGLGIHLHLLPLIWVGRTITGFFAGNLTLCLATIADRSPTKPERARNFGWLGAVGGLSFLLAIGIGGLVSNPEIERLFRPESAFFVTGGLSIINLLLMWLLFKETHKPSSNSSHRAFSGLKNLSKALKFKEVRPAYASYFLFIMAWVGSMQFLPSFLLRNFSATITTTTIAFLCIGLVWLLANSLLNPFLSRHSPPRIIFATSLGILFVILLLILIPTPLPFFLFQFTLAAIFAALSWTNGLATISLCAPESLQGSVLGINQSIGSIASIAGPIIGGAIAALSIHALYLVAALSCLAAALLLRGIKKSHHHVS